MPFRSEAQRRKFGEMVKEGKMTQDQFDEWNRHTPDDIPERVEPPKKSKSPLSYDGVYSKPVPVNKRKGRK